MTRVGTSIYANVVEAVWVTNLFVSELGKIGFAASTAGDGGGRRDHTRRADGALHVRAVVTLHGSLIVEIGTRGHIAERPGAPSLKALAAQRPMIQTTDRNAPVVLD